MIRVNPEQFAAEYEEAFGTPLSEVTERQLWVLVNWARHIRGRCRSNVALVNFLNSCFPHLRAKMVPKKDERTGETYDGLEIVKK